MNRYDDEMLADGEVRRVRVDVMMTDAARGPVIIDNSQAAYEARLNAGRSVIIDNGQAAYEKRLNDAWRTGDNGQAAYEARLDAGRTATTDQGQSAYETRLANAWRQTDAN